MKNQTQFKDIQVGFQIQERHSESRNKWRFNSHNRQNLLHLQSSNVGKNVRFTKQLRKAVLKNWEKNIKSVDESKQRIHQKRSTISNDLDSWQLFVLALVGNKMLQEIQHFWYEPKKSEKVYNPFGSDFVIFHLHYKQLKTYRTRTSYLSFHYFLWIHRFHF
jgi:hypothetical protein